MDERTQILVCVAASVASNCVPCFEHYYKRACNAGISSDTIDEVVNQARKVQNGAQVALRARAEKLSNPCKSEAPCCSSGAAPSHEPGT